MAGKEDLRTQKIEKSMKGSLKSLKKLLAGKGELQGNYYFCSNGVGKDKVSVLVVTLTAKDKTGSKASSEGKGLLALIPKAKFSRGIVVFEENRIIFDSKKGNAPISLMKKAFKEDLSKVTGMAFLKKVSFKSVDETESDESGEDINIQDVGLTDTELKTLKKRLKADPDLAVFFGPNAAKKAELVSKQNKELEKSFLSQEEETKDYKIGKESTEWMARNAALWAVDGDDPKELAKALGELAKEQSSGPSPFIEEIGGTVSTDMQLMLLVTSLGSTEEFNQRQQEELKVIVKIWDKAKGLPEIEQKPFVDSKMQEVLTHFKNIKEYKDVEEVSSSPSSSVGVPG